MIGASPRRRRRTLRGLALVLIAVVAAFRIAHGPGFTLQTTFPAATAATPPCEASQIRVLANTSSLTYHTIATIYFTNTGPDCSLDPAGPTVGFLRHGAAPFSVVPKGTYGPRGRRVVITRHRTLYAELLLRAPTRPGGQPCATFTSRQIVVSLVGQPAGSTTVLPMYAQRVCVSGDNVGVYAY